MNPADFTKDAPGKLVLAPDGYWTFEPNPLPPQLSYGTALVRKLSDAERALGELAGVGRTLPNPHLLIGPFLRREAVLSSRIEGTTTRLEQLLLFEVQPEEERDPADAREVANYVRALEHGLERLKKLPICLRLLREMHEILVEGVRGLEKRPGEFRDCQAGIGREGQSFADMRFVPPTHDAMKSHLRDFEAFLNNPGDIPLLVQFALAHYQFETIHPFKDGNGRIGRLMITLLLCERGCLPEPLLYLSAFFERHEKAYKDHLLRVSQKGSWGDWIGFFAEGVADQARDAVLRARYLMDLWKQYRERMQAISQSSAVLRLVDELFSAPIITISRAKELLNVTFPAAQANIEKLEAEKILKEVTGKPRNRVYVAPRILEVLEEHAPPPSGV